MARIARGAWCALAAAVILISAQSALAQRQPPPNWPKRGGGDRPQRGNARAELKSWEGDGTIEAIQGGVLQIKSDKNDVWHVKTVPGQSKVQLTGTAQPEFLKTGLNVRFSGAIDKKGAMEGEIAALEVFTTKSNKEIGIYNAGESESGKPVREAPAGSYDFKAKVVSFKEGVLTASAGGKKIVGKLAAAAEIKVNVDQIAYAQVGDTVKIKAWYPEGSGAEASRNKTGQAIAEELSITATEPLAPAKKTPRAAKASSAKSAAPAVKETPFGEGAAKLEDAK